MAGAPVGCSRAGDGDAPPPAPASRPLDETRAADFARLSLECVDREYPNKPGDVVDGDETVRPPRVLHPAFYGCFDWHSAVHGHWAMARLLKMFPGIAVAAEIRAALDAHLTPEKLAAELAYFRAPLNDLFERPYGWGWLLRLAAELETFDDPDAERWSANLAPLAAHLSGLTRSYLETLSVPVRAGTHHSTAFALTHVHDYSVVARDEALREVVERRARDFYLADTGCPTLYEPSGEDFVSPCLAEADLMRRVLAPEEFAGWLDRFLPPLASDDLAPLRRPPVVKDRHDPRIGHLIGLSLHRAAAFRGIGCALPRGDRRAAELERLAAVHRDEGLELMFDSGYGGAHWLASFAVYLLTGAGPYR